MAVVVVLFLLAGALVAALWLVCRRPARGGRAQAPGRLPERPGVAPCDSVVVTSPPAPRQRVRQGRHSLPALSEDDVIEFGLALEAATDVLAQLHTKRRDPWTGRATPSPDRRR